MIISIIIFIVSLVLLVKGADWLLASAEKIGRRAGLSDFITGVLIVGIGTSLPELSVSLSAVFGGEPSIPVANAIGSNIANILLIIGASAVVARRIVMKKSLIDLDLSLLSGSTVILIFVVWDRIVTPQEAVVLIAVYATYILYTLFHKEGGDDEEEDLKKNFFAAARDRIHHFGERMHAGGTTAAYHLRAADFVKLIVGFAALLLGAKYVVESTIALSEIWNIATGVISISAIAVGTSLPELVVSLRAAMKKSAAVAVGNIFGSNMFNALLVVGVPGLFGILTVDEQTATLGLFTLLAATLLFLISGITQRIYAWEGMMFLAVYVLFIGKLLGAL